MTEYDVVVVGASLAGCTAATLLGREGARVALLERSPRPEHYKTVCTHFIQASATPVFERLGIVEEIEAAGGVRNAGHFWTRYGWIRPRPLAGEGPLPHGYDIRREKLDPMLRRLAAATPGVDVVGGATVTELLRDADGRPAGVRAGRREWTARIVVGADGRNSAIARLAGLRGRVRPHGRFAYFAYYEDLPLASGTASMLWASDPDIAYAFPNDDGLTLLAAMPHQRRIAEFRADPVAALERSYDGLPDAPDPRQGRRVSKVIGRLQMPNIRRPATRPGVALVGDAAQASDPLWGVGCGWALQSGAWLADELGPAIARGGDVDAALERYRRTHRRQLAGHHFLASDYASGRPFTPLEKLLFRSATRDERLARTFHMFGNRMAPAEQLFPRLMAGAVRASLRPARSAPAAPAVAGAQPLVPA